jgi:integrase
MSRIRHSFVMIIKFAKRCGYKIDIDTNMIKLPKAEEYETTITQSQAKMIYNYCIGKTDYLSIAILLSMFTGIRISEICALKISDIEINEHTIHVYKTIQKNKNGKLEIAEVSALSNKRDVIIPDILYNYLKIYLSGHNDKEYFISNRKNGFCSTRVLQKNCRNYQISWDFINYLRNYFFHVCMRSNMNIYTLMDLYGLSQMKVIFGEENRQSMKKKFDEVQKIGWFN